MKKILIWEVMKDIGGGQKISLDIADTLKVKNDIIVAVPGYGSLSETMQKKGIRYVVIPELSMNLGHKKWKDILSYIQISWKYIQTIMKVIRTENIDILYVPGSYAMPWGAIVGNLTHIPVVWHIHHIFSDNKALWLLNLASSFKSVKTILATTKIAGKQITNVIGQKKITILYNPIDLKLYQVSKDLNKLYEEIGILKDDYVIAQIGFIQRTKNQKATVEALKVLCEYGYSAKLLIIGESRKNDNSYKIELQKYIEELGLEGRVVFLGYRNDINILLQITDVSVVMGEEGFSLVALESMACGIPVIAINKGGAAELIQKSKAGLLISEGKDFTKRYAEKLILLIKNPEIAKEYGNQGKKFAQKHDIEIFKKRVIYIFENISGGY